MVSPNDGTLGRFGRFLPGLLLILIAVGFLIHNAGLPLKDGNRLGTGAMPLAVLALLLATGIAVLMEGRKAEAEAEAPPPVPWWRLAVISVSILFVALTIRTIGMAVCAFVLVAGSALAAPESSIRGALVAGALLSVFVVAVFSWGLGLYIPVLPNFPR